MEQRYLDWLIQFLFVAGSGGGLLGFIKMLIDRHDRKKRLNYPSVLRSVKRVYSILNAIMGGTPAGRVMLMRAENGGDVPAVGKELTTSIVYEVYGTPFGPKSREWRMRPLDEEYVRVLLETAEASDGGFIIHRKTMKKASILYDVYDADHVASSILYPIWKSPGAFFYLVLNCPEEFIADRDNTSQYREFMRANLVELREIFRNQGPLSWGKN